MSLKQIEQTPEVCAPIGAQRDFLAFLPIEIFSLLFRVQAIARIRKLSLAGNGGKSTDEFIKLKKAANLEIDISNVLFSSSVYCAAAHQERGGLETA